jgi:hypothetical protein
MATSGVKPARLPKPLAVVQIDTTLHRAKSRTSSGFPVHGARFNRTLLADQLDFVAAGHQIAVIEPMPP